MRIPLFTTTIAIALCAGACDNNGPDTDVNADVNMAQGPAMNNALGSDTTDPSMPTDAAGFASAVAASDLYEIESGKLAEEKATSAEIKSFAEKLQADHMKSTADLKAAASQSNVAVSPALDAEKQAMLDQLKAASGAEFDRMFIEQQKTAHQKALSLLQNYQTAGDNGALKGFASKVTPVVQAHLDHLNGMK